MNPETVNGPYDPKRPTLIITPKKKLPASQLLQPYVKPVSVPFNRLANKNPRSRYISSLSVNKNIS